MSEDGRGKLILSLPKDVAEELEKRYPNDALRIDELKSDKEKNEYIGKLKLIRELKVLTGVK